MAIKAILFDLDETLILDHALSLSAFDKVATYVASRHGIEAQPVSESAQLWATRLWQEGPFWEYCNAIGHSAFEGLWCDYSRLFNEYQRRLGEWAKGYRLEIWQRALEEHGVSVSPHLEKLPDLWVKFRRHFPMYPEAEEVLTQLSAYRLGMVTNGIFSLQMLKTEYTGLDRYFDEIAISGEVGIGKPEPGIFEHILTQLGFTPAQCVMVGDNPERDIAGAINAGIRSVWVDRGIKPRNPRYRADLEVGDLREILPWLGKQF
jgi:putative hydrolase of the HAD superfamily